MAIANHYEEDSYNVAKIFFYKSKGNSTEVSSDEEKRAIPNAQFALHTLALQGPSHIYIYIYMLAHISPLMIIGF